jgi:protein-S-isoprenylcysteine O-methyltransferase
VTLNRLVPLVLTALVLAQEVFASSRRREGAQARDKGSLYALWVLIGLGYWTAFYLWGRGPPGPRLGVWSLWTGAALALAGMALRTWSVTTLGRYFTVAVKVADDQPVIETGPYRLIRHPSYAGALLTGLGLGLSLRYALGPLIVMAPQLAAFLLRMRVEEGALISAIGEPYRAYMARTRRLIPFIY